MTTMNSSDPHAVVPKSILHLRQCIEERAKIAESSGYLSKIETESKYIEQDGVRFLIRVSKTLAKKPEKTGPKSTKDPFEPPFPAGMYICPVSDTHSLVFNKFNLVDKHLVVITNQMEMQGQALTYNDIYATSLGVWALNGFGFYNCGAKSGASQPHKHTQVIPRVSSEDNGTLPIESLLPPSNLAPQIASDSHDPISLSSIPFEHCYVQLPSSLKGASEFHENEPSSLSIVKDFALNVHKCYQAALTSLRINPMHDEHENTSYNAIFTKKWLLVVPRKSESVDMVSFNSVAFTGSLYVRNAEEKLVLESMGPMDALKAVCFSKKGDDDVNYVN